MRRDYMKAFWSATTSDAIIKHHWPGLEQLPEDAENSPTSSSKVGALPAPGAYGRYAIGYQLDAVFSEQRRAAPAGTFHNFMPLKTMGRRAPFNIDHEPKNKPAYDLPPNPYLETSSKRPLSKTDPRDSWSFNPENALLPLSSPSHKPRRGKPGYQPISPGNVSSLDRNQIRSMTPQSRQAKKLQQGPQRNEDRALREIFDCVDLDRSGIIEKEEIVEAIENDIEVKQLIQQSRILRPLLKTNTFEAAWSKLDTDDDGGVSWAEFKFFCNNEYKRLVDSGKEKVPDEGHTYWKDKPQVSIDERRKIRNMQDRSRRQQTSLLTEMFRLIDVDSSGLIVQDELIAALENNPAVISFAEKSDAMKPLLNQRFFQQAWSQMDTDDEDGVSLDEFVEFALIVSEVQELNQEFAR